MRYQPTVAMFYPTPTSPHIQKELEVYTQTVEQLEVAMEAFHELCGYDVVEGEEIIEIDSFADMCKELEDY